MGSGSCSTNSELKTLKTLGILLLIANLVALLLLGVAPIRIGGNISSKVEKLRFQSVGVELKLLETTTAPRRKPLPAPSASASAVEELQIQRPADNLEASLATPARSWCAESRDLLPDSTASAFEAAVVRAGGKVVVSRESADPSERWWVHLPKFESEAQAREVLKELQASGIDSFLIQAGDLTGGISLGVFTFRSRAERTQADFIAKGYAAVITREQLNVAVNRLSVMIKEDTLRAKPEWSSAMAEFPSVVLVEKDCK
jgi:cell division septation protein DedD